MVTDIGLIALTPRAGYQGHRYLHPYPQSPNPDAIVAELMSLAQEANRGMPTGDSAEPLTAEGADFLAVGHLVVQCLEDGTRRKANELLVARCCVAALSEDGKAKVRHRLQLWLRDLDRAVRERDAAKWVRTSLALHEPMLEPWLDDLRKLIGSERSSTRGPPSHLGRADVQTHPSPTWGRKGPGERKFPVVLGALIAIAVIGALLAALLSSQLPTDRSGQADRAAIEHLKTDISSQISAVCPEVRSQDILADLSELPIRDLRQIREELLRGELLLITSRFLDENGYLRSVFRASTLPLANACKFRRQLVRLASETDELLARVQHAVSESTFWRDLGQQFTHLRNTDNRLHFSAPSNRHSPILGPSDAKLVEFLLGPFSEAAYRAFLHSEASVTNVAGPEAAMNQMRSLLNNRTERYGELLEDARKGGSNAAEFRLRTLILFDQILEAFDREKALRR